MVDIEKAAIRIRDEPNSSTKNDEKGDNNDETLSNGDLVANGSAPVPNGNSRLSASSDRSRKDVSLGDIESRIPAGSPNHDGKRDTIVTVDSVETDNKVRDCCPSFCYCESVCCDSYRDSLIRRGWHSLRYNVLCFVEHKYFELFILVMIGVSSLTLVSMPLNFFLIACLLVRWLVACLLVCLLACLHAVSVCLFVRLSVWVFLSFCLLVCFSVCMFFFLCLFVCLFVFLFVCLFV